MSKLQPLPVPDAPLTRLPTYVLPPSDKTPSFVLGPANRSYKHQYANIYFVRLQTLRPFVLARARRRWKNVAGDPPFVERVLDVNKGQLCYIIGTVYMDMPQKPNVLEDIARDHSLPAPPPKTKYCSDDDLVSLEDESGRIVLVGEPLKAARLVTGVVLGVLGIETSGGEFEVVDVCCAGMAPQPRAGLGSASSDKTDADDQMDVDGPSVESQDEDEWIALVSGLEIGAPSPADAQIQMLVEYLTGELGGVHEQTEAARISRLVIAGNSLSPVVSMESNSQEEEKTDRRSRKYGQDGPTFSPHPTLTLSAYLEDIARSMPVHILPGESDPAGTLLPQQPFPRAMFHGASAFSTFSCETNPTYIHLGPSSPSQPSPATTKGKQKASASTSSSPSNSPRTLAVSSGQPVSDMYKYLPSSPATRLSIAAASLRWRHLAPTAPDTLWCHPYFVADPFVICETPDVYVVGNQPAFATRVVQERGWGVRRGKGANGSGRGEGEDMDVETDEVDEGEGEWEEGEERGEGGTKRCRVVLVPGFRQTGILVLLNLRTLAVRKVQFAVEGMSAGGGEA